MSRSKRSHLNLLFDIGKIVDLLADPSGIDDFLGEATRLVAHHLSADVCSIYLYEESGDILVLKATLGLNPDAVDAEIKDGLLRLTVPKARPRASKRVVKVTRKS